MINQRIEIYIIIKYVLTVIDGVSFQVSMRALLPSERVAAVSDGNFKSIDSWTADHRVEISRIDAIAFHEIRI